MLQACRHCKGSCANGSAVLHTLQCRRTRSLQLDLLGVSYYYSPKPSSNQILDPDQSTTQNS